MYSIVILGRGSRATLSISSHTLFIMVPDGNIFYVMIVVCCFSEQCLVALVKPVIVCARCVAYPV